jgi:hypothetical protein
MNEWDMELPIVGQDVRPQGRNGTFRVVRVDLRQGVADLEYTTGTYYLEKNIPFEAIRSVQENDNASKFALSGKMVKA